MCFSLRRVRHGLFRPCGRRIAVSSKRRAKKAPRLEGAAIRGIASRRERQKETRGTGMERRQFALGSLSALKPHQRKLRADGQST